MFKVLKRIRGSRANFNFGKVLLILSFLLIGMTIFTGIDKIHANAYTGLQYEKKLLYERYSSDADTMSYQVYAFHNNKDVYLEVNFFGEGYIRRSSDNRRVYPHELRTSTYTLNGISNGRVEATNDTYTQDKTVYINLGPAGAGNGYLVWEDRASFSYKSGDKGVSHNPTLDNYTYTANKNPIFTIIKPNTNSYFSKNLVA